ncbi:unknown protein [Seminavis robusta]|uniref:Uncharacterized protein n=1 Tax=Seminavis robusta TaxID=568900 RepID=A0A9N8DL48_9STRA|nr:unknown protein [Seminavis robusta]|eukprot:Sro204_g086010.1 n/a (133) ;mRNA; f:81516-81914
MNQAVHPDAHAGVMEMDAFIKSQSNHALYKLQRNEILLCNNAAVLHARRSFPDRQLRRLDRLNFITLGSGCKLEGRLKLGFEEPRDRSSAPNKKDQSVITSTSTGMEKESSISKLELKAVGKCKSWRMAQAA